MPKITATLLNLESFQYATSLDLNMVQCPIRLTEDASNLCTIILPWAKYRYKYQPMVVSNSQDIFQQKINYLFQGFEFIHAYIDELFDNKQLYQTVHVQKLKFNLK